MTCIPSTSPATGARTSIEARRLRTSYSPSAIWFSDSGLHLPRLFLRLLDPGRAELQDLDQCDLRDPPPRARDPGGDVARSWPSSRAASRSSFQQSVKLA